VYDGYYTLNPFVEVFIGGKQYAYFPVLQYSCIFVLGVYFSRNEIYFNIVIFKLSIFIISIFAVLNFHGIHVNRFPPSFLWILSSFALCYLYFCFCLFLETSMPISIRRFIEQVGRNALNYLIISNMIIFITVNRFGDKIFNGIEVVIFFLFIVYVVQFLHGNGAVKIRNTK